MYTAHLPTYFILVAICIQHAHIPKLKCMSPAIFTTAESVYKQCVCVCVLLYIFTMHNAQI